MFPLAPHILHNFSTYVFRPGPSQEMSDTAPTPNPLDPDVAGPGVSSTPFIAR